MSEDDLSSLNGMSDNEITSDIDDINIPESIDDLDKNKDEISDNENEEDDDDDDDITTSETISPKDEEIKDNLKNKNKQKKIKQDENCLYKIIHKDKLLNHSFNKHIEVVKKENRITRPILTKYEYVAALSVRAKQLSLNAKPMIKNAIEISKILDSRQIAEMEIKKTRTCPLIIVRPLPNFKEEHWDINELELIY
jgi:DNA-directed RNA polymerase subunit K/omega